MPYDSKPFAALSFRILYQFIEDIPQDNGVCGLDCRRFLCTQREWIICRRLNGASGSLRHDCTDGSSASLPRALDTWRDDSRVSNTAVGKRVL